MQNAPPQPAAPPARPHPGAFTLIELLVVVAIIALLIGIAGVVYSGVLAGSQRAATEQFLRGLTVSIEQFENDFGYLPPLLAPDTMVGPESGAGWRAADPAPKLDSFELVDPIAQIDPVDALRKARYMSVLSLPAYLLGVGDLAPLEYQPDDDLDRHDGLAGPGFRNPGVDKAWGGAKVRDGKTHQPTFSGRSFGPYVDVGAGRNFRRIADLRAHADGASETPADTADPLEREFFTFEDGWGNPIRYYRSWPTRDLENTSQRTIDRIPIELFGESTLRSALTGAGDFDTQLEFDLLNAPYALLSAGPDGKFADAGAPALNEGAAAGSLDIDYDAATFLADLRSANASQFNQFVGTVADNVRVLP